MSHAKHTLLVVDDDETNRDMLGRRLTRSGYRVLVAASGEEALAITARERVDLVLLDVMMPGLDGIEVLKRLRRTHSPVALPVIMVTAKTDTTDAVEALDHGANDYVTKPVDLPLLLARVRAQLRIRSEFPPSDQEPATGREMRPTTGEAAPPKREVGPGTVLASKYRLDSCIGTGNFGAVYRAQHLTLDHPVAVKVLRRRMAATADAVARFQREGVSTCRIRHPNAVSVMDFGVEGEVAFLVMELLTGHSLDSELARAGQLTVSRSLAIVFPLCSVLSAAHAAGIIHRDIKPANVFLHATPHGEVVKLVDFGIAKLAGHPVKTMAGMVLGTPAYMAPERFVRDTYDGRSDVYSVGTMLYQMLCGRLPFVVERDDPLELAAIKVKQAPQPLREINPDVPPALAEAVMSALRREPEDRPQASELGRSLARAAGLREDAWDTAGAPLASREGLPAELSASDGAPTEVMPALDSDVGAKADADASDTHGDGPK